MGNILSHVAIIMDGNGRWASRRALPRKVGHYYGSKNISVISKYAKKSGVKVLTLYAFSTENWTRPQDEIDYLMTLPDEFLKDESFVSLKKSGISVKFVGRRDRLPKYTLEAIKRIEDESAHNNDMLLQICFDYGGYDEITTAFSKLNEDKSVENVYNNLYVTQPVDFLIRTGGEQRISNFLLWQIAYAELYFTKVYWPAFNEKQFDKALKHYNKRTRRFGGLK